MLRRGLRRRLGWALPLALLVVAPACKWLPSSCGKGEVVETAPPPPPRPTVGVDDVKALANSGKHEEALAMAEKPLPIIPRTTPRAHPSRKRRLLKRGAPRSTDAANPAAAGSVGTRCPRVAGARRAAPRSCSPPVNRSARRLMDAAAFRRGRVEGCDVEGAASAVPEVAPDAVPCRARNPPAPAGQGDAGSSGETVATAELTTAPTGGTDAPTPTVEPAPTPCARGTGCGSPRLRSLRPRRRTTRRLPGSGRIGSRVARRARPWAA